MACWNFIYPCYWYSLRPEGWTFTSFNAFKQALLLNEQIKVLLCQLKLHQIMFCPCVKVNYFFHNVSFNQRQSSAA